MEPIFSNSCKYTMQTLIESTNASQPKWYKFYCIGFGILFAALAGFGLFTQSIFKSILFAVFAGILFFMYKNKQVSDAQKIHRRNMEKYGQETETRIFFYEDSIVGKNLQSDKAVTTTYDQIENISETEHLYILKLNIPVVILLDKEGFISSSASEFVEFIKGKCPTAKVAIK